MELEVIEIQVLAAGEFAGKLYPPREAFPSNAAWGKSGFTYSDRSHQDPLAAALAKAQTLIGGTAGSESNQEQERAAELGQ